MVGEGLMREGVYRAKEACEAVGLYMESAGTSVDEDGALTNPIEFVLTCAVGERALAPPDPEKRVLGRAALDLADAPDDDGDDPLAELERGGA